MDAKSQELQKAREMMNRARGSNAPEAYEEPQATATQLSPEEQDALNKANKPVSAPMASDELAEMTVTDFLSSTRGNPYEKKFWKSRGKWVQIKKFSKGEYDKIAAPLMQKTMKLDLAERKKGEENKVPTIEVSMETFAEMEKVMVVLGLSFYKDAEGRPVINRHYIDTVMTDIEFKEASALIQEVNPRALAAGAARAEELESLKNA